MKRFSPRHALLSGGKTKEQAAEAVRRHRAAHPNRRPQENTSGYGMAFFVLAMIGMGLYRLFTWIFP